MVIYGTIVSLEDLLDEAKNQLDRSDHNRRETQEQVTTYDSRKHLNNFQKVNIERTTRDRGGIAFLRERVQFHAGEVQAWRLAIEMMEAARRERTLRGFQG